MDIKEPIMRKLSENLIATMLSGYKELTLDLNNVELKWSAKHEPIKLSGEVVLKFSSKKEKR